MAKQTHRSHQCSFRNPNSWADLWTTLTLPTVFGPFRGLFIFEKPRQCWHRSSLLSYYSQSFSIFVLLTFSSLAVLRPSLCLRQFTKTNSSWCKILIGNKSVSDSDLCTRYLTASPITHFMASPQLPLPRVLCKSTKLPFRWFGCCDRRGPLRDILFCLTFTEPGLSMKTKKDHKEIYVEFGFRKVPHTTSPSKFFYSVNSVCCTHRWSAAVTSGHIGFFQSEHHC